MLKIGEPLSLKDYYEQYQSKPRTARRTINAEIRGRIEDMMLNITDLDNYDAIDYLRLTYGRRYCRVCGGDPDRLPDRLESDKALFADLEEAKAQHADELREVYDGALQLKEACARCKVEDEACTRCKVEDKNFDEKKPSTIKFILQLLGLIVLFPLFIFSLIPNFLLFLAPMPFTRKLRAGVCHQHAFCGAVGIYVAVDIRRVDVWVADCDCALGVVAVFWHRGVAVPARIHYDEASMEVPPRARQGSRRYGRPQKQNI